MMKKVLFSVAALCFAASGAMAGVLWTDDFGSYLTNNSLWDAQAGVAWDNIANPVKYGRVFQYDAPTGNWDVATNTGKILFGLGSNKVWYSRDIGQIGAGDKVEYTAQVASYGHDDIYGAHSGWPLGDHIVVGGVALGIGGDDITYKVVGAVNPATTVIDSTTVTRFAPAAYKTWYDVKIVINQVAGSNNDTADLYYKLAGTSNWNTITTGLITGQDVGSKAYIYLYGETVTAFASNVRLGAIDNVSLSTVVPEPATMALLGLGGLFFARKK